MWHEKCIYCGKDVIVDNFGEKIYMLEKHRDPPKTNDWVLFQGVCSKCYQPCLFEEKRISRELKYFFDNNRNKERRSE